jgi:ABC-type nitrate/sulfonate/bicarbonate transport system ATPase subunit
MNFDDGVSVSIKGLRWHNSERKIEDPDSIIPDVTLSLQYQKLTAIIGPSGVGKSTLLKAIATWHDDLTLDQRAVVDLESGNNIPLDEIFYLPQMCEHLIFPWYSVEKNLLISMRSRRRSPHRQLIDTANGMARSLGFDLNSDLRKRPHQLSGGMRKRLAVAMALLTNPRILILDEPFVGLNPQLRLDTMQVIKDFVGQPGAKKTAIFTSHDIGEVRELAHMILGFRQKGKNVELIGPIEKNEARIDCEWRSLVENAFCEL